MDNLWLNQQNSCAVFIASYMFVFMVSLMFGLPTARHTNEIPMDEFQIYLEQWFQGRFYVEAGNNSPQTSAFSPNVT